MDKKYILGGGVLLLFVLGMIFPRPLSESYVADLVKKFGATPGTEISGNFLTIGGVETYNSKVSAATSSVICSVRNPWSAIAGQGTSTIERVTIVTKSGHSATFSYSLSTSTSAYASSTIALIHNTSVNAGNLSFKVWTPRHSTSTTLTRNTLTWITDDVTSPFILNGGEYLNVRVATATPGAENITGTCNFSLIKI